MARLAAEEEVERLRAANLKRQDEEGALGTGLLLWRGLGGPGVTRDACMDSCASFCAGFQGGLCFKMYAWCTARHSP